MTSQEQIIYLMRKLDEISATTSTTAQKVTDIEKMMEKHIDCYHVGCSKRHKVLWLITLAAGLIWAVIINYGPAALELLK